MKRLILSALLSAGAPAVRAADAADALAAGLSVELSGAGIKTIEMMPLVDARGKVGPEGRMFSGRLLSRVVALKTLTVLLGALPDPATEPYAATLDELDAKALRRRLGPEKRLAADAVILGSYAVVRGRLKVNLQAVSPATGKVLWASDADLKNEWEQPFELWSPPSSPLRVPDARPSDLAEASPLGAAAVSVSTAARVPPAVDPLTELLPGAQVAH